MVKYLRDYGLENISGYYIFDDCYNVDDSEGEDFDKNFEVKNKEVREGQLKN